MARELPGLGLVPPSTAGTVIQVMRKGATMRPFVGRLALSILAVGWMLFGSILEAHHGWLIFTPNIAHAEITYIYDRLGRLIGVVDPAGDSAVYRYDAVGNLIGIARQSSALVSIVDFNPASGPVGATVTISGTGFSPTSSENTVTFNGTAATVSAASPTQLVATVPSGATTGPIGVTAPAGSASSSAPFTVTASSEAPTITSFSPTIATSGTAVSITGTNFDLTPTNNRLRFNFVQAPITSSTTTNLSVPVPGGATSGRLSLATPGGATQSTDDFFVPPAPYTASSVSFTARASIGSATINAAITSVGKIALIVVDGTAGQQLSVGVGYGGVVTTYTTLFNPDGTQLGGVYSDYYGRDLQIAALPVTGTYTIMVVPGGSYTGTKAITLSQDLIVGSIAVGGASVPVSITRPGQRARLTFSGTAGQRLSLGFPGASANDAITITKPDGTLLASSAGTTDLGMVMPPLPTSGTYGILIDPQYADTRSMTLTLSEEISGSIVIDGSAVPLTLARVGQTARLTFAGTADQRLNLAVTSATLSTPLAILKPDGSSWVNAWVSNGSVVDTPPMPTTGTYTVVIDPNVTATGSLILTLSAEIAGSIMMGGSPVAVTTTRPGQKARLTFSGAASQRVSLNITGVTASSGSAWVALLKPNGSQISGFPNWSSTTVYHGSSAFLGAFTLATSETAYTVYVSPGGTGTASMTLTLYSVPPNVTGTVTINGGAATATITGPGQNAAFTFSGTTGQIVTARGDSNTIGCGTFGVTSPSGGTSTSVCSASFSIGGITLQAGTHTIFFDPSGTNTGSVNLSVTSP